MVNLSYVGNLSRKLPILRKLNIPRATPNATAANTDAGRIYAPLFGSIGQFYPDANANYNALQILLQRRLHRGFTANFFANLSFQDGQYPLDRRGDRARGQSDIRHQWVSSVPMNCSFNVANRSNFSAPNACSPRLLSAGSRQPPPAVFFRSRRSTFSSSGMNPRCLMSTAPAFSGIAGPVRTSALLVWAIASAAAQNSGASIPDARFTLNEIDLHYHSGMERRIGMKEWLDFAIADGRKVVALIDHLQLYRKTEAESEALRTERGDQARHPVGRAGHAALMADFDEAAKRGDPDRLQSLGRYLKKNSILESSLNP